MKRTKDKKLSDTSTSFGEELIQEISGRIREVGERFELLQWIDQSATNEELELDQFIGVVADKSKKCFKAPKAGVFVLTGGNVGIFPDITGGGGPKISLDKPLISTLHKTAREATIEIRQNHNTARFLVCFEPEADLKFAFVYEAPLPSEGSSVFHDHDRRKFASMMIDQLNNVLQYRIGLARERAKDKITDAFFRNHLEPELCWSELIKNFPNFLPSWAPINIEPLPQVQILTYDGDKASVLLRATRDQGYGSAKTLMLEKTICGILVEDAEGLRTRQEGDYVEDCLLVDPNNKRFRHRYASYLFKKPPRSELVVPIHSGEKLIGLINLEHMEPRVFTRYHIEVMRKAAVFIAPFVSALMHEEDDQRQRNQQLLYLLDKIMNKVAATYRHKVGQHITVGSLSLEALDGAASSFTEPDKETFARLKRSVASFTQLSSKFLEHLPDYVKYGRVELLPLVKDAVSEFDPEELERTDDISIGIAAEENEINVFGSTLLQEHIYNLVNNSVAAVKDRVEKAKIEKGVISISAVVQSQVDKQNREVSYRNAVVRIEDNGGGCHPTKVEPNVMKPGWSDKPGGHGFGLSAAEAYVEGIGGQLRRKNLYPEGYVVELHVPIYDKRIHKALEKKLNATQSA